MDYIKNNKWMCSVAISSSMSTIMFAAFCGIENIGLRIIVLVLFLLLISLSFFFCVKMRQESVGLDSSFKENAVILIKFMAIITCVVILMGLFMGLTAIVMQKILTGKSIAVVMNVINIIGCILYLVIIPFIINAFWTVITERDSFLVRFKEKLTLKRYVLWIAVELIGIMIGFLFLLLPYSGVLRLIISAVLGCITGMIILALSKIIYSK